MRSRLNGMVSIGEEACTGLETDGPRYFILKTCSIMLVGSIIYNFLVQAL